MIIAIDPGTTESGWVIFRDNRVVVDSGVMSNQDLLRRIPTMGNWSDTLAIEMVASYGMAVGREVFETCVWIGRFQQAWHIPDAVALVYRRDVKLHLCGTSKAKDTNIRQSLLDLIGHQGTKKSPGPTYGIRSHAWAALAVAATVARVTPESSRALG